MRMIAHKSFLIGIGALLACFFACVGQIGALEPQDKMPTPEPETNTSFVLEVGFDGLIGFVRESGSPYKVHALFANASGDGITGPPINVCCKTHSPPTCPEWGELEKKKICNPHNHIAGARIPIQHITGQTGPGHYFLPFRDKGANKVTDVELVDIGGCTNLAGDEEIDSSKFLNVVALPDYQVRLGKTRDKIRTKHRYLSAYSVFDKGTLTTEVNRDRTPQKKPLRFTLACPHGSTQCPQDPTKKCCWEDKDREIAKTATLSLSCEADTEPVLVVKKGGSTHRIPLKPVGDHIRVDLLNLLPIDIVGRVKDPTSKDDMSHFKWLYLLTSDRQGDEDYITPSCASMNCISGGWPVCSFVELEKPDNWQ